MMKYFVVLSSLVVAPASSFTFSGPTKCRSTSTLLCQSALAPTLEEGPINVAFINQMNENNSNKQLNTMMEAHPLMSMLDKETKFVEIPLVKDDKSSLEIFSSINLDLVHVACFDSPDLVHQWLHHLDVSLGIQDKSDDDKRASGNGNVVAACIGTETARVCLESGRWEANDIYYPKGDDDMQGWADSAVQAVADIVEMEFWGEDEAW